MERRNARTKVEGKGSGEKKRQARKKYARAVLLLPLGTTLLFRRESEGLLLLGTEVWHRVNWTYKVFDSRAAFARSKYE